MTPKLLVLVLGLVVGATLSCSPTSVEQSPLNEPEAALALRPVPPAAFEWECGGTVLAVTKDSLTIRAIDNTSTAGEQKHSCENWGELVKTGPDLIWRQADGPEFRAIRIVSTRSGLVTLTHADGRTTTINLADQPPRRFFVLPDEIAKRPRFLATHLYPFSYRVQDVQVGDYVSVNYVRFDRVYYIGEICIERRPGGRVPPPPREPPELATYSWYRRHHERANAEQDWEERGIPIPEKFAKSLSSHLRVPYPPVAPAPRLAVARSAAPAPREWVLPTIPAAKP